MVSEFLAALNALATEGAILTQEVLKDLSSPSRADVALFCERFGALSAARRREVVALLAEQAERDFMLDFDDLLISCLDDPDATVRCSAIEGLWEDERVTLIAPLLRLLRSDPEDAVRAAAATSLGRFVYLAECEELDEQRGETVRQALRQVVDDPQENIDVARRAIESLAFINNDQVRRLIDRAYAHGDPRFRESALFAMGRSADRFWAEIVLGDLLDPSPSIRYEATRASGELHLRRAVPQLIELGRDVDREVQLMAIWALGQIGGKRARTVLERWAAEEEDAVRAEAAVEALEELEFADVAFDMFLFDAEDAQMVEEERKSLDDEADADSWDDEADWDEEGEDEEEWPDEFLDLL